MSIQAQFKTLVGELDKEGLETLRRSVAREIEGRRQKTAIKLSDIHPRMTAEEKEQAAQEIARVLKGHEDA
jgi:hypothetical protein